MMSVFNTARRKLDGLRILAEWLGEGGLAVDREVAQSRADICLVCPKHVRGGELTEAVALKIKEQIEFKNVMELRVRGEKQLHTCGVCQCVLRLKCWLPLKKILPTPEEMNDYPSECWLKTEKP